MQGLVALEQPETVSVDAKLVEAVQLLLLSPSGIRAKGLLRR